MTKQQLVYRSKINIMDSIANMYMAKPLLEEAGMVEMVREADELIRRMNSLYKTCSMITKPPGPTREYKAVKRCVE